MRQNDERNNRVLKRKRAAIRQPAFVWFYPVLDVDLEDEVELLKLAVVGDISGDEADVAEAFLGVFVNDQAMVLGLGADEFGDLNVDVLVFFHGGIAPFDGCYGCIIAGKREGDKGEVYS